MVFWLFRHWMTLVVVLLSIGFISPRPIPAQVFPHSVGVFPFYPKRGSEKEGWITLFLTEGLREGLMQHGNFPVLTGHASELWQKKLGLQGLEAIPVESRPDVGVARLITGTVHLVLKLAQVQLRITGSTGENLLGGGITTVVIDVSRDSPSDALRKVFHVVGDGLGLKPLPPPVLPNWKIVQAFYETLAKPFSSLEVQALAEQRDQLRQLSAYSGLRHRGAQAIAELWLREGMLANPEGEQRRTLLTQALEQATQALDSPPWHSGRIALKGEIHFLLKQDLQAKTDANFARLKNPMEGLAHVVAALVAGLSTGSATDSMRTAFQVNPFLASANLPSGTDLFQGGVLEPMVSKWQSLREDSAPLRRKKENPLLQEGIAHFEKQNWRKAEAVFLQAAEQNEYDFEPLLYLARIQIETGRPENAVTPLRRLADEFPQAWEVHYYLGIAFELSESFAEAERAFEKAHIENEHQPEVLYHLGTALMGQRRWKDAQAKFETLLKNTPDHERGWLAFGIIHVRMEQWKQADKAFERVLELNPNAQDASAWRKKVQEKLTTKAK